MSEKKVLSDDEKPTNNGDRLLQMASGLGHNRAADLAKWIPMRWDGWLLGWYGSSKVNWWFEIPKKEICCWQVFLACWDVSDYAINGLILVPLQTKQPCSFITISSCMSNYYLLLLDTVFCVCGHASRAQPPHSTAHCGWCLCGERLLRSWPWTGSGPCLLLRCSQDLKDQRGMITAHGKTCPLFPQWGNLNKEQRNLRWWHKTQQSGRESGIRTNIKISLKTLKSQELAILA